MIPFVLIYIDHKAYIWSPLYRSIFILLDPETSLVQKTLFKWGEFDFLNQVMIRLIGGRFKKLSLILSLPPLPDLKSFNLNRLNPSKSF